MTLRFLYTYPNGVVAYVVAAPKETLAKLLGTYNEYGIPEFSDADYRAHVLARSIPKDATNVIELKEGEEPPADRRKKNVAILKALIGAGS